MQIPLGNGNAQQNADRAAHQTHHVLRCSIEKTYLARNFNQVI